MELSSWTKKLCDGKSQCLILSLSSLRTSSVYLDPQSLLGLTTLIAAFLNSSKHDHHMHGTVANLRGPRVREAPFSDRDFRQRKNNPGNTELREKYHSSDCT